VVLNRCVDYSLGLMNASPLLFVLASALTSTELISTGGPANDLADDQQAGPPAETRVLELTLEDAIRIVLEHNLELRIEDMAAEIARSDALGTWGSFDPLYQLNATYFDSEFKPITNTQGGANNVLGLERRSTNQSVNFPLLSGGSVELGYDVENSISSGDPDASLTTSTDASLSLTLVQPLLRGAWSTYSTTNQRIAEIAYASAAERRRQVRQDLLLRVHEAYWNLVEAIEQVDVRALSLRLGNEQLDQDKRRLDVGVGTEVDVLQAETNVATNEEQLLLAQVDAEAAEDTLKSLLFHRHEAEEWGRYLRDWETPVIPLTALPDVVTDQNLDWTRSLGRALELRTELVQQRLVIQDRSLRLVRAKSETLPGMSASFTASNRGFTNDFTDALNESIGSDFPTYTAVLNFDVPLFNRAARSAKRSARIGLLSARLEYDNAELNIVSDVRAKVRDLNYQVKAVQAARKSLELAERQLQAEQARYREGLSTTFQLLQFQEDLAQALSTERSARAGYARAAASLEKSEGWLGEQGQR